MYTTRGHRELRFTLKKSTDGKPPFTPLGVEFLENRLVANVIFSDRNFSFSHSDQSIL